MIEVARLDGPHGTTVVAATERDDGSMHPGRVDHATLRRRQLAATASTWSMTDQVHGRDVVAVTNEPSAAASTVGVGDVLVAIAPSTPIAVWTADCAPLFLVDAEHEVIVGAHVGWRGLALGVVDVAVDAFERAAGGRRAEAAVLGPTIGACCYAFGERDLRAVAAAIDLEPSSIAGTNVDGRTSLDMPEAIRRLLSRRGIELTVAGPCTRCDDRWFSHRRGDVGRLATVVWTERAADVPAARARVR